MIEGTPSSTLTTGRVVDQRAWDEAGLPGAGVLLLIRAGAPPTEAELVSVARAAARALTPAPRAPELRLTQDGEVWAIEGGARTVLMRDSRGLRYLHRLVTEPGRVFHVLELTQRSEDGGHAGEHLDPAARSAYKARLVELEIRIVAAESAGDEAALEHMRREVEFLSTELARAVGLGGRARRAGCPVERARVAVTRRIRETIGRIARQAPELGAALARVKTGTHCVFVRREA